MNVNGEESSIQQTLFSVANQYLCSATENELLLKTKYYKAGVPFHFHWKLTKSSVDEVSDFVQSNETKSLTHH